jgi:hypothetical protein
MSGTDRFKRHLPILSICVCYSAASSQLQRQLAMDVLIYWLIDAKQAKKSFILDIVILSALLGSSPLLSFHLHSSPTCLPHSLGLLLLPLPSSLPSPPLRAKYLLPLLRGRRRYACVILSCILQEVLQKNNNTAKRQREMRILRPITEVTTQPWIRPHVYVCVYVCMKWSAHSIKHPPETGS